MKSLTTKMKLILFASVCIVLGIGIGLLLVPMVLPCQTDTTVPSNVKREQVEEQKTREGQTTDSETVYWTPNGKVYHLDRNCTSLNHSAVIESGSIEQSGKPRACKLCS